MQAAGCITIKRRTEVRKEEIRPQLESSEENLLASYNEQVRAVQSLQATVDLIPSTGTTYSGVIEEYHDVPGFILAAAPRDGARDRAGPGRRQRYLRHGQRRKGIPDLYSIEKLVSGRARRPSIVRRTSPLKICALSISWKRCSGRNFHPARMFSLNSLISNREPLLHPDAAAASAMAENSKLREKSGTAAPICGLPRQLFGAGGKLDSDIAVFGLAAGAPRLKAAPAARSRPISRAISISGARRTITNSRSRF